jgi:hypothetical protein
MEYFSNGGKMKKVISNTKKKQLVVVLKVKVKALDLYKAK